MSDAMAHARGRERAPSHNAYRGAVGSTRQSSVLVTVPDGEIIAARVYVAVDVIGDPELGQRLLSDSPDRALNVVRGAEGNPVTVNVPVVYHDPANEVLALVLPEGDRHRELEARANLYSELARDTQAAVPAYVRDFAVVFGAAGLRAHLERLAERAVGEQRAADGARDVERERQAVDRRRAELAAREQELERRASELERRANELERRASEQDRRTREQDRRAAEIDVSTVDLDRKLADADRIRTEMERARAEMDRARLELERERRRGGGNGSVSNSGSVPAHVDEPTPTSTADRTRRGSEPPAPGRARRASQGAEVPVTQPGVHTDLLGDLSTPMTVALAGGAAMTSVPTVRPDSEIPTRPVAALSDDPDHTPLPPPAVPPETSPFELLGADDAPVLPLASDPITTTTADGPLGNGDAWCEGFAMSDRLASVVLEDGRVRVAVRVPPTSAGPFTSSPLDVRLLVHRQAEYPVITLVIGTPAALRGLGPPHRVVAPLDIANDGDRRTLGQLERDFAFELDVVVDHRRLRRARVRAPLAENVGYVMRAASDHLRAVPAAGASFGRAVTSVLAASHDLLGLEHPEHGELRADKLESLSTANQVRRALAMARRFIKPAREDYLVTVRGFPLARWRELRASVLTRAVAMGLWLGPELAQAAVSEGLARSRKDLIGKLDAGFAALLADAVANDLDPDAIEDNRKALAEEAQALGLAGGALVSDAEPVVSGTISSRAATPAPARGRTVPELIALLDDRQRRVEAALELCERGDASAVRPVMNAVRRMGRSEAVRVLGAMVKLGPAAAPALTAALASSKAFLRHGCALALALLRTEAGTEAVVDALLAEPTEIWREIARAVGHIGPPALMPLAARLGRLGDRAGAAEKERIAWAMAHVGVRGGKAAVQTLAAGQSAVAPVAAMALERLEPASRDDVHGRQPVREVTVNRAFSRRFFEALERGLPEVAAGELQAMDASGPMELLDEADLIDDLDESTDDDAGSEAELDESDLLPG